VDPMNTPAGQLEGFVVTREVLREALHRHKLRHLIGGLSVEDIAAYVLEAKGFTDVKILQKQNLIRARLNGKPCLVAVKHLDLGSPTSQPVDKDDASSFRQPAVTQPVYTMEVESWEDEDEDGRPTIVARCILNSSEATPL